MVSESYPLIESDKSWWWQRRTFLEKILLILFLCTFLVSIGGIVGSVVYGRSQYDDYQNCQSNLKNPYFNVKLTQDVKFQNETRDYMMSIVDGSNIENHLKNLTKDYHPAGSPANKEVFDYILTMWRSFGLDKVELEPYDVLLSYPNYTKANTIYLTNGTLISNGTSTPLGPDEALDQQHDPDALIWWNAYSASGNVSGEIVYVNYCTEDDYAYVNGTGVNFTGKIVLCRYGDGWRGQKVALAEQYLAVGVILYSDPEECGPPKADSPDFVFPESIYMPPSGAQRGSLNQLDGDPETPLYPSKSYVYRWFDEAELKAKTYLPSIPVMPIGYRDAIQIFRSMESGTAINNTAFQGGMDVTYYITSSTTFQLTVNTYNEHKTIQNAIGYIYGSEEPDQYVLVSNHVDAWTYGGLDPNSGTAISLEMARVFMTTINATGWRPRRTIVFCQWDAEEYGLLGSTEWAEQKLKTLESRAVALINVDIGVQGNETLSVSSVPLLYKAMIDASKLVSNPNMELIECNLTTVYDSWVKYRGTKVSNITVPYMSIPSGGSDHKTFLVYIGIPVVELSYAMGDDDGDYPLYHSNYEIEWTVANLVDVDFKVSVAMGQVWGEVIRNLADSIIIPFSVSEYGSAMIQYVDEFQLLLNGTSDITSIVFNYENIMNNLTNATQRFADVTAQIQTLIDEANGGSPISLAMIDALNSRLISLERAFIDPRGIPGRPHSRHIVFSSSIQDAYSASVFSGVTDTLVNYQNAQPGHEKDLLRKLVNIQITAIQYSLESAIELLQLPPSLTM